MDEPIETKIGELGELFDGPHATPTRRDEGPYFLNISSLKSGRLDLTESDHVSDSDFTRWTKRVTPQAGDLLFSYETRLGEAALMPDGVRACLGRRMALLRPDRTKVDPRFLLYFYLSPGFQRTIAKYAVHGATVSRIGLATMPDWDVEILTLSRQQAIAEVLGALDDKIAADEREILAAEALMVGIVESLHSYTSLSGLVTQSTSTLKPEEFKGVVAHYSLPAFDDGAEPEHVSAQEIKSNKFALLGPCVLFSKLNPRIPRIWNVVDPPEQMAVASTEFVVILPKNVSVSAVWAAVRQPEVSTELQQNVAGTSGSHQRIRPHELLSISVRDVRKLSTDQLRLIDSLGERCHARRVETRRLVSTRDELLPHLMSGKLRVRDAEAVVSEVL